MVLGLGLIVFGLAYRYITLTRVKEKKAEEEDWIRQEKARIRQEVLTAINKVSGSTKYRMVSSTEIGKVEVIFDLSFPELSISWTYTVMLDAETVFRMTQEAMTRSKVAAKQMN